MRQLACFAGCVNFSRPAGQEDCSGVQIGVLPTLFHEVSGTLYAEDDRSFCIQNFNYDGLGPGKLHLQYLLHTELSVNVAWLQSSLIPSPSFGAQQGAAKSAPFCVCKKKKKRDWGRG